MNRETTTHSSVLGDVVGPDHQEHGTGGAVPRPTAPVKPSHPDSGDIPSGGVELRFHTADKKIAITICDDGKVIVVYDVVNAPSHPHPNE